MPYLKLTLRLALCHGTPLWHLTHVYLFPPTQQLETDHEIAAIYGNLWQSAIFCHVPKPILPRTCVNWAIKLMIYTPSSHFLISFPYVIFWFHYTVYVYSLIISTLLYIIVTCTYSVTLCCVNHLYYCMKCRTNLKPP